jgi:polyribonucleotide nucleotidyltransferase
MYHEESIEIEVGGRPLRFSTGKMAKQANGAMWVSYGDSVVLVTATMSKEDRQGVDFLPLTVDYREYTFAGGKIPGGFFKREGRPTEAEVLVSRVTDRPLRPLFPEGYHRDTQVIAMVLSADYENTPDIMAINGASFALYCSDIPFNDPIAAVRIGMVDGEFLVNPSFSAQESSVLNLVVAGTKDALVMVEAGAKILPEDTMLKALELAHQEIRKIVAAQEELFGRLNITKMKVEGRAYDPAHYTEVEAKVAGPYKEAMAVKGKLEMYRAIDAVEEMLMDGYSDEEPGRAEEAKAIAHDVLVKNFRRILLEEGRRVDGRLFDEIRPIWSEVGVLPRTHGSAVFTRGETQALVNCTLGTASDVQRLSGLLEGQEKHFILHYNFPPFSVGETKPLRSPGRREVGHGALAERSLDPVVPSDQEFPYTIRVVSDILESNGSSSQATICGATLALMDAGVPITAPVAGVAMGLVIEGERYAILSDIAGLEDHYGDMDFKVAGTEEGITALQMDIKVGGISFEIMRTALEQAKRGRLHILGLMKETLPSPRTEISRYAPRIYSVSIPKSKIGDLIGPGGKTVRGIQEATGAEINIEEDGTVTVASLDEDSAQRAMDMIRAQVEEPEVGKIYKGTVRRVEPYGAFVEILPGQDGLLHVSELDWKHVDRVEDYLKLGDEIEVKLLDFERGGKLRLSRKALLEKPEGYVEAKERPRRPQRDQRSRGDRDQRGRRSENRR